MTVLQERRQTIRVKTYLPVRLRRSAASPVIETLTKDIGTGGLRCLVQEAVPAHTALEVEITLPRRHGPAVVQAQTMWLRELPHCDQFEIGLAFSGPLPAELRQLILGSLQA